MPPDPNLIDDVMTLGGNMLGNLLGTSAYARGFGATSTGPSRSFSEGWRGELKAQARQRVEMLARRLDLVSREEFDAAFAMLAKARAMQEDLSERLAAVEAKLKIPRGGKKKSKRNSKK